MADSFFGGLKIVMIKMILPWTLMKKKSGKSRDK